MKAYKATRNGKCINITYQEGKIYTFQGKMRMCQQGFHFCKNPKDTIKWYHWDKDFQLMEIEVIGEIVDDEDGKSLTDKFKVLRFIPKEETKELLGIIEEYDENNNLIYYKHPNGKEYWKEYDENNNLIHFKNSNGIEEWREYDENNNLIHYKDYNEYEYWLEYDKQNNLIYFKSSSGKEEWKEYDEQNNLIHSKDSRGYEEWKEYDEQNNVINFKDSREYEEWKEYDKNNNLIHFKDSYGIEWSIQIS